MHAHTSYNIKINGSNSEIEAINKVLKELITDENFKEGSEIEIEETYKCVFPEDVEALAIKIARTAPNAEVSMEGVIDTSESAGEYMNFMAKLSEGNLAIRFSDWYLEEYLDNYDSFEEFADEWGEEVPDVDIAFFNKIKEESEFAFFLETRNGMVMSAEVPLGEEKELRY